MRHKIIFILSFIFIFSFPTFGANNLYKIAVLPFDDGSIHNRWWGARWEVGKGVSDELVTALLATNKFRVIEREQIKKVLHEQNFDESSRVDEQGAAKIGKILGVQFLVMGRVTEFSIKSEGGALAIPGKGLGLGVKTTTSKVVIDARLVDATSAEIIAAVPGTGQKESTSLALAVNWNAMAFGSSDFKKTDLGIALRDAVTQVATGLANQAYQEAPEPSALTGMVFYAKDKIIIINIGSDDGVQNGMVFIVNHVIDVVKDPDTGEVVDEVTQPVAEITVTEVKEKTSTCAITNVLSKKYQITVKDKVKQK